MNKALLDNIETYSINFQATHLPRHHSQVQGQYASWRWLKRLFKIIGADVLGAIGGAIVGGAVSGNPVVTVGAAILSGMGASFEAGESYMSAYPPNTPVIDTMAFRHNLLNPYDFVGDKHNSGLDYLKQQEINKGINLTDAEVYLSSKNYTNMSIAGIPSTNLITQAQFDLLVSKNAVIEYLKTKEELLTADIPVINAKINNLSYLNVTQKQMLCSVFSYSINISDEKLLLQYFKGLEDIISSSNLDNKEKQVYLSGFAVGRASTNYWYDVKNGNR